MKIFIVEDDPGIRKELKQLLENAFYEAEIIEEFKDTAEQICSMIPARIWYSWIGIFRGKAALTSVRS